MFESIIGEVNHPLRFKNIDCLRACAILGVVVLHFNLAKFHYGALGVDLFFVLSGFLVSEILIRNFRAGRNISPKKFLSRRAVRILPSYLTFIFVGGLAARFLYSKTHPEFLLHAWQLPRYLFFFYNYAPLPNDIFNHVWSLCVEEHFYILLPTGFFLLRNQKESVVVKTLLAIVGCVVAVKIALFFRNGYFAYAYTHGRLDALIMGVLARWGYETGRFKGWQGKFSLAALGVGVLVASVILDSKYPGSFFAKVWLHFLSPLAFSLILIGTLGWSFKGSLPIRVVSYFSYNWYLWHLILSPLIFDRLGKGAVGFATYLTTGFALAVIANRCIEIPLVKMSRRKKISISGRSVTSEIHITPGYEPKPEGIAIADISP